MPNYCTYPQALELFQKVDETKQNTLIAGSGITIDPDNTISATGGGGGSYTAGDGIDITGSTISLDLGEISDSNLTKAVPGKDIKDALDQKQGTLTFDDTPTQNSSNPVKSGGVYSALSGKQNTLTFDNVPTNGSNNPVKSDGIYDALAPKVSESLLKDTVGWVGKNELPLTLANLKAWNSTNGTWSGNVFTHTNGPTFTVSTDDEGNVTDISVTGNPSSVTTITVAETDGISGSKILNGIDSGSQSTFGIQLYDITTSTWLSQYATDGDASVTLESGHRYRFAFFIRNGVSVSSKKIYPMLRKASITDSTFEPYHKSVEDWYWENNPNAGVKNIINIHTAQKKSNAVLTFNGDDLSIVVSSASNYDGAEILAVPCVPQTDYIISYDADITSGKSWVSANGRVGNSGNYTNIGESSKLTSDGHKEYSFNSGSYTQLKIILFTTDTTDTTCNVTISNLMLRDARDTDSTYQPYAMTNRELTEKVLDHSTLTYTEITEKGMKIRFQRKNNMVLVSFGGELTEAVASTGKICDIPLGFRLDLQYGISVVCFNTTGSNIKIVDVLATSITANSSLAVGDKLRGSFAAIAQ